MKGEGAIRAVHVLSIPGRRTSTRYIKLFCLRGFYERLVGPRREAAHL